jgi:hypothetical protein
MTPGANLIDGSLSCTPRRAYPLGMADATGERVFGDTLNWESSVVGIHLAVELPFWLMVPSSPLRVTVSGFDVDVEIRGDYYELHCPEFTDSRRTCVYLGPDPAKLRPDLIDEIKRLRAPAITRKCKTVLRIPTAALTDAINALDAVEQSHRRAAEAVAYFRSLAAAHIPVVNEAIRSYRLATYDYFPFEVSPWDVPVWFVQAPDGHVTVPLFPYAKWDLKPAVDGEMYSLITPEALQAASSQAGPGELDLLDALTLMERGDYSGAVRRITTALEVSVEARLRAALSNDYPDDEVNRRLDASKTDFPGRLRQWAKLTQRRLPAPLAEEIDRTRSLRHEIVHGGRRLTHIERGLAQRAVDTSRWAYNFIEGQPDRARVREERLGLRSLGRFVFEPLFEAEITATGAVVYLSGRRPADNGH